MLYSSLPSHLLSVVQDFLGDEIVRVVDPSTVQGAVKNDKTLKAVAVSIPIVVIGFDRVTRLGVAALEERGQ